MRFISTISRAKDVVMHMNKTNYGCKAHTQGKMRFIRTRSRENYIAKRKKNDK
jgi:hypothetical protein